MRRPVETKANKFISVDKKAAEVENLINLELVPYKYPKMLI